MPNAYFSFTGSVTYRTAKQLRETAANIPDKNILVESESPFMIPAELKGKRNKPSYIHYTVQQIATLREQEVEAMADILYTNACNVFKVDPYRITVV